MSWKIAMPMYDIAPAIHSYYRQLITGVVAGLRLQGWLEPVEVVENTGDLSVFWRRRDVLLAQTCGYPLVTYLRDDVELVATPCFDADGCEGPYYSSALVVPRDSDLNRLEDCRGKRVVINDQDSNSGMNALRHAVAPLANQGRFFGSVEYSGTHITSLAHLARGSADLAAIDAVTLAYATDHLPSLVSRVRVIGHTASVPALPLVASKAVPTEVVPLIQNALTRLSESMPDLMTNIRITGFVKMTLVDYQPVINLRNEAISRGYPEIV